MLEPAHTHCQELRISFNQRAHKVAASECDTRENRWLGAALQQPLRDITMHGAETRRPADHPCLMFIIAAVDVAAGFCQKPYGLKATLLRRPVHSARTIQAITLMNIRPAGEKQLDAFQVSTFGRQV